MSERLHELTQLLERAEAHATRTHEEAAEADRILRAIRAAVAEERGRRRHLRGLVLLPAAIGTGAATAKAFAKAHAKTVVAIGGAAAITAGGIWAHGAMTGPDDPHRRGALPAPTVAATAAPHHSSRPHAGPPLPEPTMPPPARRAIALPARPSGGGPPAERPPSSPPIDQPPTDPGPPGDTGPAQPVGPRGECTILDLRYVTHLIPLYIRCLRMFRSGP